MVHDLPAGGGRLLQRPRGILLTLCAGVPTFENGGTQVNISGAAVAKHAPNKDAAVQFLEYLASDDAQKIYAEANYEYPVNAKAAVAPLIAELGELKADASVLTEVAAKRKQASELTEAVGFDN